MTKTIRQLRHYALAAMVVAAGLAAAGEARAFGLTLDEIYRDTLRHENAGELPGYVINRGLAPYPEHKPPVPDDSAASRGPHIIDQPLLEPMPWPEVVRQVGTGRPSPFAVDAVRIRSEQEDGQAVELLGWMYANGIGVRRDLPEAFSLYVKAEKLGVSGAQDNAKAIYKSMSRHDRQVVFNPYQ